MTPSNRAPDLGDDVAQPGRRRAAVGVAQAEHVRPGRVRGLERSEARSRGWRRSRRRSARRRRRLPGRAPSGTPRCRQSARGSRRARCRARGGRGSPTSCQRSRRRACRPRRAPARWHPRRRGLRASRVAPKAVSFACESVRSLARAEELLVFGIRARPSTLDVVDAELIELLRDEQLVVDRERHGLALGAVAERRVEGVDAHGACGPAAGTARPAMGCRGRAADVSYQYIGRRPRRLRPTDAASRLSRPAMAARLVSASGRG